MPKKSKRKKPKGIQALELELLKLELLERVCQKKHYDTLEKVTKDWQEHHIIS